MKHRVHCLLALFLCLSLFMSTPALGLDLQQTEESVFVKVSKLIMQPRSLDLILGSPDNNGMQLFVAAQPENATIDMNALQWSSSKPEIALVSEQGFVTAVSGGRATITAYDEVSRKRVKCTVRVYVLPESLTMNKQQLELQTGRSASLRAKLDSTKNLRKQDKAITWATSDPNVATVTAKGKVTAVGAGTAVITAVTVNGVQSSCTVTVDK